jgi:hypothetical protein
VCVRVCVSERAIECVLIFSLTLFYLFTHVCFIHTFKYYSCILLFIYFFVEQKYTGSGLSLLELPKKHVHTVLITFKEAEAEAYKKIEMYFAEQYTVCKESSANGVSVM